MFFWISSTGTEALTETVSHGLLFTQTTEVGSTALASGLGSNYPLEFARATNGYVYMADGINPVTKWDGLSQDVKTAGNLAPTTKLTLSFTGAGEISGEYVAYVRYVDEDGNVTNFSPVSSLVTATNNGTVNYTDVPVPSGDKIRRKQILRNTAPQKLVFYVDIDTTNITGKTFSSTKTDLQLRQQAFVALFDQDLDRNLANRHGVPPNDKPLIAFHENRLWLYGDVVYEEGNVSVERGNEVLTGIGTQWTSAMNGRTLYFRDQPGSWTVSNVNVANQTIDLGEKFRGITAKFAEYKIRSGSDRRNLLFYSEKGLFDSWPALQSIEVAASDDIDDEPTGLASTHSFLYILQRRHIYRLTFLEDPSTDGAIFLAARRGCVNNRSWVSIDGFLYALDDQGIYRFDGTHDTESLSQNVQDLFYFDSDPGELRINWNASKWFHASHDRHDATIRWFVAFSGDRLPRHAICFNYSVPQWWIEEYPFACGDSSILKGVSTATIVCGKNIDVFAVQVGSLDVVDPREGDTRGLIEDWTRRSVTFSAGVKLPETGVVGAPLSIVDGAGRGQTRRIATVSGRKATVTAPWTTALDADQTAELDDVSVAEIGAMPWSWKSGWMEWPIKEEQQPRKVAVGFKKTAADNKVALRVYTEYSTEPEVWSNDWPRTEQDSSGVETEDESPDALFDTTVAKGYIYHTIDSLDMYDEYREGIVSVELIGYSCASSFSIFEIDVMGAQE